MTHRRRHRLGAWALVALLASAPDRQAQLEGEPAAHARAPAWLADAGVTGDELRRAVARSLPEALPALLACLAGADVGELEAADGRRDEVRQALSGVPLHALASAVAPLLEPAWTAAFDDRMRVEALRLLAARANAPQLALLARIAQPPATTDGTELLRGAEVRSAYEDALAAMLTRDPEASHSIWHGFDWLPDALRPSALRALARAGGDDTLARMAHQLGARPELAAFLLPELERAARRLPVDLDDDELACVRGCLLSSDPTVVAAAVPLAACFADAAATPHLLELLACDDVALRARVRRTLVDLTGRDAGARDADWESVLRSEHHWWTTEGAAAAKALPSARSDAVASTLARLASRRLHARRLGPCLETLLRHRDPSLVAVACATVGRLRVRAAADELRVVAKEHADDDARAAARDALRVLAPDLVDRPRDEHGD